MGKVLGIVYRTLSTHLIRKAGFTKAQANTGAVALVQRVFTLQALAPSLEQKKESERVAKAAGFSLHAGVGA